MSSWENGQWLRKLNQGKDFWNSFSKHCYLKTVLSGKDIWCQNTTGEGYLFHSIIWKSHLNNPTSVDQICLKYKGTCWAFGFFSASASVLTSWVKCYSKCPRGCCNASISFGLNSCCEIVTALAKAMLSPNRSLMPPSSLQGQDMSVERTCWCKGFCYVCATGLCSRRTIPWL